MSRLSHHLITLFAALVALATCLPADAGARKYNVLRWTEDWSWLESEMPSDSDPFDAVKNVELGDDWRFTFGGSFRLRFEADDNRIRPVRISRRVDDGELIAQRGDLLLVSPELRKRQFIAELTDKKKLSKCEREYPAPRAKPLGRSCTARPRT